MRFFRLIALWICVWSLSNTALSGQTPVQINENERLFLGRQLEYFVDTTEVMSIDEAVHQEFTPNKTDLLNLGSMPHAVWIRFSVNNVTDQQIHLEINNPLFNELAVYQQEGDAIKPLFIGGFEKPFRNRPVASENWMLNLNLTKGVPANIYIRGRTIYSFQVPVAVSTTESLLAHLQRHYIFWGLYLGVMLFAFIYNFFIYLSVRERSYLYYLLYIIGSATFYISLEGFGFQFIWPDYPQFNPLIPTIVNITNCIIVLFTLNFLRIGKDQKVLYYWGWTSNTAFILLTLLNITGPYAVALPLSQLFSLLVCVYLIVAGISSLRRGVPTAKYFLIGWSAFLITVIIFILTLNNVLPSNFFTNHGIFLGHMTEVLLLSFALADRINLLKAENAKKQQEIIIGLEENKRIQTKMNRELEQKVSERTAEVRAQKDRSDELLLNILPSEVAEELKAKGTAEAKLVDNVTVLFTDFTGFTELSEKISPQSLIAELNLCFSAFDNIIGKYKIEKIKTIGDSYMAASGLHSQNGTHAEDMVNASLEILDHMRAYKSKKIAAGEPYFDVRIGIHSGSVIAGIVGWKKFAYDIWGDTVNTASRMESNGEIGKINISKATYALVNEKFNCTYRGKISTKGKGELDMYFVEGMVVGEGN